MEKKNGLSRTENIRQEAVQECMVWQIEHTVLLLRLALSPLYAKWDIGKMEIHSNVWQGAVADAWVFPL